MGMTFSEQKSQLARFLGDPNTSSSDQWPLADREFEINRGELQFSKDSLSVLGYDTGTVSGSTLSLPSDFFQMHVLIVNDKKFTKRREIAVSQLERFDSGDWFYFWANTSGTRQLTFIDSGQDGKTYKHFYFAKHTTDLSSDSDESILQDEYRSGPVHWAAFVLLQQIGKTQLAEYHKSKYDELVNEAFVETRKLYVDDVSAEPDVEGNFEDEIDTVRSRGEFF